MLMLIYFLLILDSIFGSSQAITNNKLPSMAISIEEKELRTYIVSVKKPKGVKSIQSKDLDNWYQSFLPATTTRMSKERLVHSYSNTVTGFAARLTAEEVKEMEEKDGFLSAYPEKVLTLQTTHTPEFLGLKKGAGFWNISNYGKGLIIAVLDTGVTPDHPSFSGEGIPPPPEKWRGKCDFTEALCSNKIIGAKNFVNKTKPPLDDHGHGTHTASIAAGRSVPGVQYLGQYNGTAFGVAPLAHLAIYKVCDASGSCTESDILAGMDAAIEDGVDVLSLSLGSGSHPFYNDSTAVGAFGAVQKGIFVSCAAGNYGPRESTLSNEAPWILTVGASTVDRNIRATVLLGNKEELNGQSLYQPTNFSSTLLPLVYPGIKNKSSAFCEYGSLKSEDVKGKVVLCLEGGLIHAVEKGQQVKDAGGAAMILMNDEIGGNYTEAEFHVLPASYVTHAAGLSIIAYINSTSSPMATISFNGTVYGVPYAPQVAAFSSQGPSLASPGILKPDILGPGYNILAAWPPSKPPSSMGTMPRFKLLSGTSMACPHLAGAAALLKSTHSDWSPAAIKSALMTTADILNLGGSPITDEFFEHVNVFATGAGQLNPSKANDPGLIYDIKPNDYIQYLCGLNYTDKEVTFVVQNPVNCSNISSIPEAQLNYPAFSIRLGSSPKTYTRTVTNVGPAISSYISQIVPPPGVDVKVIPSNISFGVVNQKATYTVTFTRNNPGNLALVQGYLSWISEQHIVRSPIAVVFEI